MLKWWNLSITSYNILFKLTFTSFILNVINLNFIALHNYGQMIPQKQRS